MIQYIPKSAVLAEIRKYKNNAEAYLKYHHNRNDKSVYAFEQEKLAMCELLSSLDTLGAKEINLEEINRRKNSMDKVQKIREEVERMHNLLPVMDGDNISVNYADRICTTLEMYIDSLQEEPVSEDLEEVAKERVDAEDYCYVDEGGMPLYDSGYLEYMFKEGAKWQLAKNKSITLDDLGEFTNELSKQFPEVSFAKVCKIATRTAKWQKAQMMAKAINTKASLIMSVPSICISLPLGVNVGDKVKVIVIKED